MNTSLIVLHTYINNANTHIQIKTKTGLKQLNIITHRHTFAKQLHNLLTRIVYQINTFYQIVIKKHYTIHIQNNIVRANVLTRTH